MLPQTSDQSSPEMLPEDLKDAQFRLLAIDVLDDSHQDAVAHGVKRILDTHISEITYAQIIDGLPLSDVADDSSDGGLPSGHPIYKVHNDLCPSILDRTREFRHNFNAGILKFDSRLLFLFQAASPGSRSFNTRLIEIVASSIHQIARILFQVNDSSHKDEGIIEWAPPKSDEIYWRCCPDGPPPTVFYHPWYMSYQKYPHGVADMVGYWAEARIIGGVVLFDRRQVIPGFNVDPDAIYLHPNRANLAYRICKLLDDQKQNLLDFLTSSSLPPNPLPILVNEYNEYRIDPEESTEDTGIYRDVWDRSELPPYATDERLRDVWDRLNFPTRKDKGDASKRAHERKFSLEYGDAYNDRMPSFFFQFLVPQFFVNMREEEEFDCEIRKDVDFNVINLDNLQHLDHGHSVPSSFRDYDYRHNYMEWPYVLKETGHRLSMLLRTPHWLAAQVSPAILTKTKPNSRDSPLVMLPQELFNMIVGNLSDVQDRESIVCLSLTCRYFFHLLGPDIQRLMCLDIGKWCGQRLIFAGERISGVSLNIGTPEEQQDWFENAYSTLYNLPTEAAFLGTYPIGDDHDHEIEPLQLFSDGGFMIRRARRRLLKANDEAGQHYLKLLLDRLMKNRPGLRGIDDMPVLRNLNTKEFVHSVGLEYDSRYIGEALMGFLAFAGGIVSFPGMTSWAGDCFDICPFWVIRFRFWDPKCYVYSVDLFRLHPDVHKEFQKDGHDLYKEWCKGAVLSCTYALWNREARDELPRDLPVVDVLRLQDLHH
ncbi:hypothetical protein FBEOM_3416 [Fusarium beomiforme]|uniref:F-box domain-containing protein n=1 Tax=Fusarium beomiforme TaxID=44412 RepID=A0A9P5E201_9HYPO|nr:hypothetical protein FBEOM_3416 [Fusarium beomiforme]